MSATLPAKTMENKLEAALDRSVTNGIQVSAKTGLLLTSMSEAMEFAKLMALGRESVPKHCRESPGVCLSICVQAMEWRMNPLALANESYVVNDRLCWKASLYQSVVARRAPIVGRVKMEFTGEGPSRVCRVWAELDDASGIVEYTSPLFATINPKNSPLWKNDPDQQLFYFSVRSFARRHFPDVMMGVYTVDEMQDAVETVVSVDSRPKSERLTDRLLGASAPLQTTAAQQSSLKDLVSAIPGESEQSNSDQLLSDETAVDDTASTSPASLLESFKSRLSSCNSGGEINSIMVEAKKVLSPDDYEQLKAVASEQ